MGKSFCKACADQGRDQCTCAAQPLYWCEYCLKAYDSKRCPACGIKLKKIKANP